MERHVKALAEANEQVQQRQRVGAAGDADDEIRAEREQITAANRGRNCFNQVNDRHTCALYSLVAML